MFITHVDTDLRVTVTDRACLMTSSHISCNYALDPARDRNEDPFGLPSQKEDPFDPLVSVKLNFRDHNLASVTLAMFLNPSALGLWNDVVQSHTPLEALDPFTGMSN